MASTERTFSSPTLKIKISEEEWAAAVGSKSGGCLIAEAIKRQYPNLSRITVDMATIRATDREKGLRFTWLAPPLSQHLLLAFDQGWRQPVDEIATKRAVVVSPVIARDRKEIVEREARLVALQDKVDAGEELTKNEKISYSRLTKPSRPVTRGKTAVKIDDKGYAVVSGPPPLQGKPHPNLLRGSDRHFGAKIADPGMAFKEAVAEAVEQRLAEQQNGVEE